MSLLDAGTAEAQRQLLAASASVALSTFGAAQLWACSLEACGDGEVESVAALAAEITAALRDDRLRTARCRAARRLRHGWHKRRAVVVAVPVVRPRRWYDLP